MAFIYPGLKRLFWTYLYCIYLEEGGRYSEYFLLKWSTYGFITGKPRHVEVKLKCKKSESPSAVSIYLLEPKTCEYVLGVESPLVCDILASADEYGLMKVSSKSDFNTATTIPSSAGNLFLLCPKN